MKKHLTAVICMLCLGAFCLTQTANASTPPVTIKPQFLQATLKTAGVESHMLISAPNDEFSRSLYLPHLGGSAVTIGFPSGGILRGRSFYLQIDDMAAIAKFTADKKLEVVAGDSRIESVGAFAMVDCILSSVFQMVEDILKNVATLNILGIVTSVFTGVMNILGCI